jgi:hypothetical protein
MAKIAKKLKKVFSSDFLFCVSQRYKIIFGGKAIEKKKLFARIPDSSDYLFGIMDNKGPSTNCVSAIFKRVNFSGNKPVIFIIFSKPFIGRIGVATSKTSINDKVCKTWLLHKMLHITAMDIFFI